MYEAYTVLADNCGWRSIQRRFLCSRGELADRIDEELAIRDQVYFFGDGEGAVVANAVACMMEKVGLPGLLFLQNCSIFD